MKIGAIFMEQTHLKQNKLQEKANFEQCINTPTKQNSGDAFYWAHLEQLQQSALRFEAHALKNPKPIPKQLAPNKTPIHQNSAQATPQIIQHQVHVDSFKSYEITDICPLPEFQINKTMPIAAPHTFVPNYLTHEIKDVDKAFAPLKQPITPLFNAPQNNKKHHLFTQGNQAQLTLNTKGLNPLDKKELIQLIQNRLKQAGLSLSHLIINGVNQ